MAKIIHYCWFGGKPLSKLAKKCIKSWEKYLPDYEIKRWDESNFDVNITNFSKQAYEAEKWAFVADVARVYALKKYGGIYFDTDMLVVKDVDFLSNEELFIGWESKDYVNGAVFGVKNTNNPLVNDLWEKYNNLTFSKDSIASLSIPKLLTTILRKKYGLKNNHLQYQKLENNISVYPQDYFYPLSYDHKENLFTDNTCMIHYFDASWISKPEKKLIRIYRLLGREKGEKMICALRETKRRLIKGFRIVFYPVFKIRNYRRHKRYLLQKEVELSERLSKIGKNKSICICHPEWLGVKYATEDMFGNVIYLKELYSKDFTERIANIIVDSKPRMIIFSAFATGWIILARKIKELDPSMRIKILWHGSNSMHIEGYDWASFNEIFTLHREEVVESIGFVKKSMAEFYKAKGFRAEFVMNTVSIDASKYTKENNPKRENVKIGLYASGDRWVKNFYNQVAATSLIEEAEVDCIPISNKVYDFAELLGLNVKGEMDPISRKQLFKRISENDINVYVTFVECAPILPLESFELGVPCITGNNHHYWEDHELRKYIVVEEADNVMAIYDKINFCLENKEKVLKLYSDWKRGYDKQAIRSRDNFLK